jgi:hypothetical protein
MFKFEFESKEFDFIKYLKNEKKTFPIPFGLGPNPFSFPRLGPANPSPILFNRPN